MNSSLIVFQNFEQKEGINYLLDHSDTDYLAWLMRQSSTYPGMIAVDILVKSGDTLDECEYGSERYAYIPKENKWREAMYVDDLEYCRENMESVTPDNTNFMMRIDMLLRLLNETKFLSFHCMKVPDNMRIGDEKIGEMVCPILSNLLIESTSVGILDGRYYDYNAIVKWVRQSRSDPMTRRRVSESDIKLVMYLFKSVGKACV
jgi:hypothetical protein